MQIAEIAMQSRFMFHEFTGVQIDAHTCTFGGSKLPLLTRKRKGKSTLSLTRRRYLETMETDEEERKSKSYIALQSDLSAALSAFDRAQDWADLAHDLQRVNRVLHKHFDTQYLPDKMLLAKRLAQCLTSSLPSGVHLKTLETYHLVFQRIGNERLAKDLPIYAVGLFPLLSYAATSLKPALFKLFEVHILPLDTYLRPVLDGLVLALLPGLEDETSEFYDRTKRLLENIMDQVADYILFYKSIWRALLLVPPARLPAAQFLKEHMLNTETKKPHDYTVADMNLVAYALSTAIGDTNTFVKRSALDILVGNLSLDQDFFCGKENFESAVTLVNGALRALLRKDMSLNKRIHSWLLGGYTGPKAVEFCKHFSQKLIRTSLKNEIEVANSSSTLTSTAVSELCSIVNGLLDREEVAQCMARDLSVDMLRFCKSIVSSTDDLMDELRNVVGDLFSQLGSEALFESLESIVVDGEFSDTESYEVLSLVFSIMPQVDGKIQSRWMTKLLRITIGALHGIERDLEGLNAAIRLASHILSRTDTANCKELTEVLPTIVNSMTSFFTAWTKNNVRQSPMQLQAPYKDFSAQEEEEGLTESALLPSESVLVLTVARESCSLLLMLGEKATESDLEDSGRSQLYRELIQAVSDCAIANTCAISVCGAKTYQKLILQTGRGSWNASQLHAILMRNWRHLNESVPNEERDELASTLLRFQEMFPELWKDVIADGILSTNRERRFSNIGRFAFLWEIWSKTNLECPPCEAAMFLMFDALADEDTGVRMLVQQWLSRAFIQNPSVILDPLIRMVLHHVTTSSKSEMRSPATIDFPRVHFAFQTLSSIIKAISSTQGTMKVFSRRLSAGKGRQSGSHYFVESKLLNTGQSPLVTHIMGLWSEYFETKANQPEVANLLQLKTFIRTGSYLETLCFAPVLYLLSDNPGLKDGEQELHVQEISKDDSDSDFIDTSIDFSEVRKALKTSAAEFFTTVIRAVSPESISKLDVYNTLVDIILILLCKSLNDADRTLQLHLLAAALHCITSSVGHRPYLTATTLRGLIHTFAPKRQRNNATSDTLGVQRRWIEFASNMIENVGCEDVVLFQSTVIVLIKLLRQHNGNSRTRELLVSGLYSIYASVLVSTHLDEAHSLNPAAIYGSPNNVPARADSNNILDKQAASSSLAMNVNLNPLRMFEYVKDVFVGTGDTALDKVDPRRIVFAEAFGLLSRVVPLLYPSEEDQKDDMQHVVISHLSHFKIDLVAATIVSDTDLKLLSQLSAEQIVNAIEAIHSLASTWKDDSKERKMCTSMLANRELSEKYVEGLIHGESTDEDLLPPSPARISDDAFKSYGPNDANPAKMMNFGEYFVKYGKDHIVQKTLSALADYLKTVGEKESSQPVWQSLQKLSKRVVSGEFNGSLSIAFISCLASFAQTTRVLEDKRHMKDFVATCASLISRTTDFLAKYSPLSKKNEDDDSEFATILLVVSSLASDVPPLVDALPESERSSLLSSIKAVISVVGQILRQGASRAASIKRAANDSNRAKLVSQNQPKDDDRDTQELFVAAMNFLHEIAKRDWGLKPVRQEMLSIIEDTAFFHGKSLGLLRSTIQVVTVITSADGAGLLLARIGSGAGSSSSGITAVFALRASELVLRVRAMQRLSFCIYSTGPEQCTSQLPLILERLRDALRMSEPELTVSSFLCLRILLLRTGPKSIAAFRATTLSEVLRILSDPLKNLSETLASLQLLDLMMLLNPPEFSYERCFFTSEDTVPESEVDTSNEKPSAPATFNPLVTTLSRLKNDDASSAESGHIRVAPGQGVFAGKLRTGPTRDFLIQYAAGLVERNSSPGLCSQSPDLHSINAGIEEEFLE